MQNEVCIVHTMETVTDKPETLHTADVPPIPRTELLREILLTATLALILGVICSIEGWGLLVVYVILMNLVLIPYRLYRLLRFPHERKLHLARILIWLATIAIIFTVHSVRDSIHRENANAILAQVDTYAAEHGHCPASIKDMGISEKEFSDKLGRPSLYQCEGNEPVIIYTSSLSLFDRWVYDYKRRSWRFQPD